MKRHKTLLLRLATNLASREAGFVFALLGVIVQACHTWFLAYDLSSLPGIWRLLQAGLMAIFISAALLYFTLKSSDDDSPQARKYRRIVWWFACVETFINLYYWGDHLLIKPWPNPDYGSFIIAVPFSILLPFVLKSYGSEVRTEDYSELDDEPVDVDKLIEDLDNLIADTSPTKQEEKVHEDSIPFYAEVPFSKVAPKQEHDTESESEPQLSEEEINKMLEEEYRASQEFLESEIPTVEEMQAQAEIDNMLMDEYQALQEFPESEIPTEEEIQAYEEEVNNELDEPLPEPEPEPQVPVIDAKGNDARWTDEQPSNEPRVVRPQFASSPKEQIVTIKNGAYTSAPAYVAEKK